MFPVIKLKEGVGRPLLLDLVLCCLYRKGSALVWSGFLPRPQARPRSSTHPPVIQPGVSKILSRCHLILLVPLFLLEFYQDQLVCHKVPQPQEKGRLASVTTFIFS